MTPKEEAKLCHTIAVLISLLADYTDDLTGSQFVIRNPNATTTCGCGSSFSV